MKLPTIKLNDTKQEAYIVLPYDLPKNMSEDAIFDYVYSLLNDFLADRTEV